jgi:hypothetical protein
MTEEEPKQAPKSGEDRAAAAALDALDNARREDLSESGLGNNVDIAALDEAIKYLSVGASAKQTKSSATASAKTDAVKEEKKPPVKVKPEDVAIIVSPKSFPKISLLTT